MNHVAVGPSNGDTTCERRRDTAVLRWTLVFRKSRPNERTGAPQKRRCWQKQEKTWNNRTRWSIYNILANRSPVDFYMDEFFSIQKWDGIIYTLDRLCNGFHIL